MKFVFKILALVLSFNIMVLVVSALWGVSVSPANANAIEAYEPTWSQNYSDMPTAVGSILSVGNAFANFIGRLVTLLGGIINVGSILSQPPFSLNFEVAPGLSFADVITIVVDFVYGWGLIEFLRGMRMTE